MDENKAFVRTIPVGMKWELIIAGQQVGDLAAHKYVAPSCRCPGRIHRNTR